MQNLEKMMAKCQPPTSTVSPIRTNRCRQTRAIDHHHHRDHDQRGHRYPNLMHFQQSSSLYSPILLVLFFCVLLMEQQRNGGGGADAFLLAHRKMLVPFASSRGVGAFKNGGANIDAEMPAHLVGFLVVPNRHGTAEEQTLSDADADQHDEDNIDQLNDAIDTLFGDAETGKSTFEHSSGTASEHRQNNADRGGFEAATDDDQMRMAKRMHHLSILRKIGAPGANNPASRLFGPSRQRELKRRSWVIQY